MKHLLFVKNLIHFTLEYYTILKSLDISTGYSFEHQIIMYINEFQHIRERIGKIIKGKLDSQDRDVIYTAAFVTRMKCQIRGALSAVTRYDPPSHSTHLHTILSDLQMYRIMFKKYKYYYLFIYFST